MNIFYLDKDPVLAAQMHCDKHVVKMILESAQLLSTAHRLIDGDELADERGLYKATHKNHPSSKWVRDSSENYEWLWNLYDQLLKEYTYRYDKNHKSGRLLHSLWTFPMDIQHNDFTPPPQCMPDYCKGSDTVEAYRTYYVVEKCDFATWKKRNKPEWFKIEEVNKDKSFWHGLGLPDETRT